MHETNKYIGTGLKKKEKQKEDMEEIGTKT